MACHHLQPACIAGSVLCGVWCAHEFGLLGLKAVHWQLQTSSGGMAALISRHQRKSLWRVLL